MIETKFYRGTIYYDRYNNLYIVNESKTVCDFFGTINNLTTWLSTKTAYTKKENTKQQYKITLWKTPIKIHAAQELLRKYPKLLNAKS